MPAGRPGQRPVSIAQRTFRDARCPASSRQSKKNAPMGSSPRSFSTSSRRPNRRIVTWKGRGRPVSSNTIASPSSTSAFRRGTPAPPRRSREPPRSHRSVRGYRCARRRRPCGPGCERRPSSIRRLPRRRARAAPQPHRRRRLREHRRDGRKHFELKRAERRPPPVRAAVATRPKLPAYMAARLISAGGNRLASPMASCMTPASAPWRSSPARSWIKKRCSRGEARENNAPSVWPLRAADPAPRSAASDASTLSTLRWSRFHSLAAGAAAAAFSAAKPMPMRPCGVSPDK